MLVATAAASYATPLKGTNNTHMALTRLSFRAATTGSLTVFSRSLRAASAKVGSQCDPTNQCWQGGPLSRSALASLDEAGAPRQRSRGQARDVEFTFRQYHNQTPASSLHTRLVQMWEAVYKESGGRLVCKVFAQNNNIQGSDPAALKALVAGEIEFFTLMGGILGTIMPVAEVQQVPYAFRSAADAHRAMDGPLGAYLVDEMAAKGIHGFRTGAFDNGMREITSHKPIAAPADLAGLKMRVPAGQLVADTFKAFGCDPVIINSDSIYAALKDGRADAQENPRTLAEQVRP